MLAPPKPEHSKERIDWRGTSEADVGEVYKINTLSHTYDKNWTVIDIELYDIVLSCECVSPLVCVKSLCCLNIMIILTSYPLMRIASRQDTRSIRLISSPPGTDSHLLVSEFIF